MRIGDYVIEPTSKWAEDEQIHFLVYNNFVDNFYFENGDFHNYLIV